MKKVKLIYFKEQINNFREKINKFGMEILFRSIQFFN